jgi:hypothetical protein
MIKSLLFIFFVLALITNCKAQQQTINQSFVDSLNEIEQVINEKFYLGKKDTAFIQIKNLYYDRKSFLGKNDSMFWIKACTAYQVSLKIGKKNYTYTITPNSFQVLGASNKIENNFLLPTNEITFSQEHGIIEIRAPIYIVASENIRHYLFGITKKGDYLIWYE